MTDEEVAKLPLIIVRCCREWLVCPLWPIGPCGLCGRRPW